MKNEGFVESDETAHLKFISFSSRNSAMGLCGTRPDGAHVHKIYEPVLIFEKRAKTCVADESMQGLKSLKGRILKVRSAEKSKKREGPLRIGPDDKVTFHAEHQTNAGQTERQE